MQEHGLGGHREKVAKEGRPGGARPARARTPALVWPWTSALPVAGVVALCCGSPADQCGHQVPE